LITVIAHYRVRPDAVEAVRDLLARHAAQTEQETGCVQFLAHQSLQDATRFALYEVYDSPDAFAEHRETKHFRANIEGELVPLLVERTWTTYSEPL
jgi:(4S)-4-hydroxy-5-phosphonooxypentane-2,3-dione isomerase